MMRKYFTFLGLVLAVKGYSCSLSEASRLSQKIKWPLTLSKPIKSLLDSFALMDQVLGKNEKAIVLILFENIYKKLLHLAPYLDSYLKGRSFEPLDFILTQVVIYLQKCRSLFPGYQIDTSSLDQDRQITVLKKKYPRFFSWLDLMQRAASLVIQDETIAKNTEELALSLTGDRQISPFFQRFPLEKAYKAVQQTFKEIFGNVPSFYPAQEEGKVSPSQISPPVFLETPLWINVYKKIANSSNSPETLYPSSLKQTSQDSPFQAKPPEIQNLQILNKTSKNEAISTFQEPLDLNKLTDYLVSGKENKALDNMDISHLIVVLTQISQEDSPNGRQSQKLLDALDKILLQGIKEGKRASLRILKGALKDLEA